MKLHGFFGCVAALPILLSTAAAQMVSVRTDVSSSETLPGLPGLCTQTASAPLVASVGGACDFSISGGSLTLTTGAAGSRPELLLTARAQVVGMTSQARVSYRDSAHANLSEPLTVKARAAGAPAAVDIVFTGFLTGNLVAFVSLDGIYSTRAALGLFVGEWGTTFQQLSNSTFQATTGTLVAHVPFQLFAGGGGANIALSLDVSADVSTGFASGTRTFSAGSSEDHTAGVRSIQVLDAFGNDVSAFYDVRTSFGSFPVFAVPEPESYAMLLAGLAAIGAMRSRRVLWSLKVRA